MSFTVYTSNRMEMLAGQLGAILARPLQSPLTTEIVVVQSKGMQRWLAMELAGRYGVWANCAYPFPNTFIREIFARGLGSMAAVDPFEPATMLWRIMRLVDSLKGRSEFAEIQGYLRGASPGLKLYQLAGRIADTFDQYTVFRGELLAGWEAGEGEHWQAVLWRALVAESGAPHRGRVQAEFLRRLAAGALDRSLFPERISVFGISYLPAFHLQVLAGLAAFIEVNLFIMSPCQEYWGDILPGRVIARLAAAERDKVDEGNQLLASLGRLGRDFSNLLLECGEASAGEVNLYQQAAGDSLLATLQNDILNLHQAAGNGKAAVPANDGSLRCHSCHSAMREVEVLHDNLLQLLADHPELQPRDILVMTPDIETYSPYIAAVFDGGDSLAERIPYSIADRNIRSDGKLADALVAILDLVGQRFTAPGVMAVLSSPAVHGKFGLGEADLDLVKKWLEETAIRWGLDEHDRERSGLQPYREQSWLAGLERLLLGYALPEEDGQLFAGILPYDNMEGGDPLVLGRLVSFVTALHQMVASFAGQRSLTAWSELLQALFDGFFAPGDAETREASAIARVLGELGALQHDAAFTAAIELPVVRAWLLQRFSGEERGLGFLSGGVTFCAMLPMRSIPFKVIAMIGMNDGLFPRQSRPPGFDLISRSPRPGDRSLRHEDRYLFLEAILSARQHLYISYTGQSIRDNSIVPPSTLVSELLDYLQRNYAIDATSLLTRHRLQPFSPDYFNGSAGLYSYSRENFAAAARRQTTARVSRPFVSSDLPMPPPALREVSLASLCSFFANPAAYLLRHRLGIRLEAPAAALEEREPFSVGGLAAYGLKEEILERTVCGESIVDLLSVAKARGILPPARHGELLFQQLAVEAVELAALVRVSCSADRLAPLDFDLQLGEFRLHGRLDNILPDYRLHYRCAKLGAKDQLRLWIEHLLLNQLKREGYPLASRLIMADAMVELPPHTAAADSLQQLLALYWQGLQRPLKFFPRSSLAYVKSGRLEDAAKVWNGEHYPESDDRAYRLCFGEQDPLDEEFARIAAVVFGEYQRHKGGNLMRTFAALTIELAGRNLIEASAGTGKTYAITSLYVRLLVEEGLLPENILVVTFTEAATKELRDRVRQRISEARDAFSGLLTSDELLLGMLTVAGNDGAGLSLGLERLEAALQTFDCAAISTIHGFCSRALQENAFESGSLYDTELTPLQAPLVRELVDDFWRRNFFGSEAELLPLADVNRWTPETLVRFLKGKVGNPALEIVPRFTAAAVEESETACRQAYAAVAAMWQERRGEISGLLGGHEGLRRSDKTYRPDVLQVILEELDSYLADNKPFNVFGNFERFTASFIAHQRQKKKEPPQDPFFDCCQSLADSLDRRRLAFLWSLVDFVSAGLPRKKAQHNLRFYDDLLTDLLAALEGENGALLAGRIRGKFKAALIDEFQDTDQVQYRIFRSIFADDLVPLFLIGDPKQAIYSFRGADIFAYLAAKTDIPLQRHFTMDRNWRSTGKLVEAVNLLFSRQPQRPLLFADLDYPAVTAARPHQPLLPGDRDAAPLQFWFLEREGDDSKPLDLNRARPRIVAAVVAEIAGLLADGAEGRATIAARPVEPGDIAIVVRSHNEAGLVHGELTSCGIPAVVRSSASIFASEEALELCTLLAALAEPAHEGKVRAALVTAMLGVSGNDIVRLLEESGAPEWEQRLARFRDYHDLWRTRGFMTMFRRFLAAEGVRGRLLAMPGGERRLTNLLHCSELLHGEESSSRLGIDPLNTWFCNQVSSPPEGEEHQIRLESDEKAVRILTVHVSKGLEFPIVFCPFSWGGVFGNDETVICHEGDTMVADFGSESFAEHRQLAREETLAENLRLLYVALTRAKYRCYLVWGRFKQTESAALAYLLHGPRESAPGDILLYLATEMKDISDAALLQPLEEMAGEGRGLVTVTVNPAVAPAAALPLATELPPLLCRTLDRRIETGWQVTSFSAFAGGHLETAELPDHDERRSGEPRASEVPPPEGSIFAFPRGAKAGTFLHEIFEKIDFSRATTTALATLVNEALGRSSFAARWGEPLTAMVEQTVSVPLGSCFCLAELAPGSWLTEMEFYFPLRFIGSRQLTALLQRHDRSSRADLARVASLLDFREVQGMVRGFVDLVCTHQGRYYILDWKSNHLGNSIEDYGQEQLSRAMADSLYPLQYLLYTVALNRYLQLRDPGYRYEEHFGGVFYLFLRGIDAARPTCGVFHDLPAAELVHELTACLIACEGA